MCELLGCGPSIIPGSILSPTESIMGPCAQSVRVARVRVRVKIRLTLVVWRCVCESFWVVDGALYWDLDYLRLSRFWARVHKALGYLKIRVRVSGPKGPPFGLLGVPQVRSRLRSLE